MQVNFSLASLTVNPSSCGLPQKEMPLLLVLSSNSLSEVSHSWKAANIIRA